MKKTNNILTVFALFIALLLTSCSQDDITTTKTSDFENLRFKVNVENPINTRAASDGKTTWSKGDQIYISIDGDKDNLCNLIYDGSDWNVSKLTSTVDFKESGKLNGVFADTLKYISSHITTWGDILYTDEGTYKKDGDVVYINLNMNKRPVAKVKINGIPDGFWIENMREYTNLNISDMAWDDTSSDGKLNKESEENQTCTFYGTLAANDGNTTIKLINGKGAYYSKTFTGKSIAAGDYITVQGPEVDQNWDSFIPVESISATKDASIVLGDTQNATNYFTFSPENVTNKNVTYKSEDETIATVDENGVITGKKVGETNIIVTSKDGNHTCDIKVKVADLTSLVTVNLTGISTVFTNNNVYYGRTYNINNNSSVNIYVTSIGASNYQDINKSLGAGQEMDETLYFRYNVSPQVTVKFTYNNKEYEIQTPQ